MEIKSITVADLKKALSSEDFWLTKTLPITKHRALSYIHNPRADKNDPVLLIAYQANQVVGYLGILPDKMFVDRTVYKFGWLTSWWVDPACAAGGVGAILLFKALNAYHQQLGVSGGSKEARRVLGASQKFPASRTLKGLEIRFRLNLTQRMLRKPPAMGIFRAWFKIFDAMMDEIVNLRSYLWKRRSSNFQHLTFEYIGSIDEETGRFIQQHHQHDLTRKGKVDLSWMMIYPWILSAPMKNSASGRYFFSSLADRFFYLGVKVFEQNNGMVGFFILKVRDDRMSLVYSFFEQQHALSMIAAVVCHTLAMEVSVLSLYDERLVAGFSKLRCPHWSTRAVSRGFYLSKAFANISLTDYRIHGGDGDLAFY
jgi:hypothetical protein